MHIKPSCAMGAAVQDSCYCLLPPASCLREAAPTPGMNRYHPATQLSVLSRSLPSDGRTALMLSCVKGFRDSAQLLLEAGADPGAKDTFGGTAM